MITIDFRVLVGTITILAFVLALGLDGFRKWRRESERFRIWKEEQDKQPRAYR